MLLLASNTVQIVNVCNWIVVVAIPIEISTLGCKLFKAGASLLGNINNQKNYFILQVFSSEHTYLLTTTWTVATHYKEHFTNKQFIWPLFQNSIMVIFLEPHGHIWIATHQGNNMKHIVI